MAVRSGTEVHRGSVKFLQGVVDKLRLVVERQVELASPVDDKGTTLYSQLMHLKKTVGVVDPLLEPIEYPKNASWILDVFWKLNKKRQYDGMSGNPTCVTYTEILAYSKLKKVVFTSFDLDALQAMEDAYFEAYHNLQKGRSTT